MPPPNRPRNPARFTRKHWAAFLAPPYLLSLLLLRDRFPEGPAFPAAALPGIVLFLSVLAWNFLKHRTEGHLADSEAILVWGGVAAMEIHAVIPFVARSRTVPASLIFLLFFLLPAYLAFPVSVACVLWFPAMVAGQLPFAAEAWSTAALAAVAGAAGALVRHRIGRAAGGKDAVREAIAHGRSIVRPREETPTGPPTPDWKAAE